VQQYFYWASEACRQHLTHDVDEAALLADRILVLADGRIEADIDVELERPRHRAASGFGALRPRLLAHLGVVEEVGHRD
jgi:sulfonate transport system ATP-binding protein